MTRSSNSVESLSSVHNPASGARCNDVRVSEGTFAGESAAEVELVPARRGARRGGGVVTLALIGAALATVGDANHAHTDTLRYAHPWLFEQAWWVAPLFF